MRKQFGAKPTNAELKRYSRSKNWSGDKFLNLEDTSMNVNIQNIPKLLYKQFFEKNGREPSSPIPVLPLDHSKFSRKVSNTKIVWYGHSVILMHINGKTILVDPMFGNNAAPISPFSVSRFSKNTLQIIDELPEIDLVLISHDHYDHLDYASIQKIAAKVKIFGVALGVGRHLKKWGFDHIEIHEFDWWDNFDFQEITITFTPSRHFSGRGLTDRSKSLWGGWTFKTSTENIWFSGDGGYGGHFKQIGEKLGPFDFGIMECGQYNENWRQIHMFPEESIQAALDAQVNKIMAVHWAGFALAQHHWKDPIERFVQEARKRSIPVAKPKLGEIFTIDADHTQNWWEQHV